MDIIFSEKKDEETDKWYNLNLSSIIVIMYICFYVIGGTYRILTGIKDPMGKNSEYIYLISKILDAIFISYLLFKRENKILLIFIIINIIFFHTLGVINGYHNFLNINPKRNKLILISNSIILIAFINIVIVNYKIIK